MTTPLVASWRITLPYVSQGFTHKVRGYAVPGTVTGGVQFILNRSGTGFSWVAAAQGLWDATKTMLNIGATTAPGTATLEQLVGSVWNQVDSVTPTTGTIPSAGSTSPAWQYTLVLRDTGFKKMRVVVSEGNVSGAAHSAGLPASGQGNLWGLCYTSSYTVANSPWLWQVGRDAQYLLTSPIAGYTVTLNRKLRRRRGYL